VSSRQVMGSLPCGGSGLWRVGLAQFDQAQPDLRWQLRRAGIARPGDRGDPKAPLQPSLALGPTRTLAQPHPTGAGQRPLPGDRGQAAAADQASIVVNSAQYVDTRFRHQRPQGVKIGLAVGYHRHDRSTFQHALAGGGGFDPAMRFFLVERPFAVPHTNPAATRPNLAGNQAQASLALGIHCHHGMQQRTTTDAFANFPQTGCAFGLWEN
jgi:hypothetical protein